MRRNSLRVVAYYVSAAVQVASVVLTAGVAAAFRAEPKNWNEPAIAKGLQWVQENGWWLLLAGVAMAVIAKGVAAWTGPPWAWNSINKFLNVLRDQVFDAAPEDAMHDHRATLFKFRRNVLWIWPWRCWWCPWGRLRVPWSGWLVPVARSGHTTQRTNVVYLAPDDAKNVEGIAGEAWSRNEVVLAVDLPALSARANKAEIAEYAKKTFVSEAWVRHRIKSGKPCPRSLCGIPVEVDTIWGTKTWGTIVLDSCHPQGIKHESENWEVNLMLIPLALKEFLKRA